MSAMRTLLPNITEDDRQLLHYNPNTDDLVEWAQEYAIKAVQAWQAARTVPEGYVMVPVELLDRFPEINEFNYNHDDVCELNAWGIDLVLSAAPEGKK